MAAMTAPNCIMVFQEVRVMALVMDFFQIYLYLVDLLGFVMTVLLAEGSQLVALCNQLGLLINVLKSDLVPKQILDFVGIHYNLIKFQVTPTTQNISKVLSSIKYPPVSKSGNQS
jgi:hypothetical protein